MWILPVRSCVGLYVLGQELVDAVDGVIGNLREHDTEIEFRVEALASADHGGRLRNFRIAVG